jgi:hypothetical protein
VTTLRHTRKASYPNRQHSQKHLISELQTAKFQLLIPFYLRRANRVRFRNAARTAKHFVDFWERRRARHFAMTEFVVFFSLIRAVHKRRVVNALWKFMKTREISMRAHSANVHADLAQALL